MIGIMHSQGITGFLAKLWRIVNEDDTDDIICWSENGRSIIVLDSQMFSKHLLPRYFKHNNLASFIRQLNMYGFKKHTNVEGGGLTSEMEDMVFSHPYFVRSREDLLIQIKRKINPPRDERLPSGNASGNGFDVKAVIGEVQQVKAKQESVDNKFNEIKRENENLWRQVVILQAKHNQQQQVVNKLIHFLMSLVQPNRGGISGKRSFPLMIDHCPIEEVSPKIPKTSTNSKSGLEIHDVTDCDNSSMSVPHLSPIVDGSGQSPDLTTENIDTGQEKPKAKPSSNITIRVNPDIMADLKPTQTVKAVPVTLSQDGTFVLPSNVVLCMDASKKPLSKGDIRYISNPQKVPKKAEKEGKRLQVTNNLSGVHLKKITPQPSTDRKVPVSAGTANAGGPLDRSWNLTSSTVTSSEGTQKKPNSMVVALQDKSPTMEINAKDLEQNVNNIQLDLDNLRDLITNSSDINATLLSLFEESGNSLIPPDDPQPPLGNELVFRNFGVPSNQDTDLTVLPDVDPTSSHLDTGFTTLDEILDLDYKGCDDNEEVDHIALNDSLATPQPKTSNPFL